MPAVLQSPSPAPSTPGNKVPWKVELPKVGAKDDQFGGCRSIEVTYEKVKQIGEGTYGQVRTLLACWTPSGTRCQRPLPLPLHPPLLPPPGPRQRWLAHLMPLRCSKFGNMWLRAPPVHLTAPANCSDVESSSKGAVPYERHIPTCIHWRSAPVHQYCWYLRPPVLGSSPNQGCPASSCRQRCERPMYQLRPTVCSAESADDHERPRPAAQVYLGRDLASGRTWR